MALRSIKAGLNDDISLTYDKTKTSLFGNCKQRTVDGKIAIGNPLNRFIDVQTDAALTPAPNGMVMTENGRLFVFSAEASAIAQIAMYSLNYSTGSYTYVGRIQFAMPDFAATTHIYRYIKILDSGTTGWKIAFGTTGTVLINGGSFLINNVDLADFVPVGFPTIPFATGNNQKAVYFTQDAAFIGVGQLQTATVGAVLNKTNGRLFVHNGTNAIHQYYVYDLTIAPTYLTSAVTGTAANDRIAHSGHTFVNGDQVTFPSLTGGAGLVVSNTYFIVNSVAGVDYQLSATSGGAAINFTTDITAAQIGRAFGISSSNFLFKTGNLPAVVNALVATDSEDFASPQHGPNAGFDCAFFSTTSNLYLGKLSDLTAGVTTWPSLSTVNALGTPNKIISPVITYAAWSNVLDKAVYSVGQVFVIKPFQNNIIDRIFGGANNRYFEGINTEVVEFQPNSAITGMDIESGWIGVITGSTGQRGVFWHDLRSDSLFDYSYFITKILESKNCLFEKLSTTDALFDYTGSLELEYKTSNDPNDVIFDNPATGWTSVPFSQKLNSYALLSYFQVKCKFATTALDTSISAQLCEMYAEVDYLLDNSEHWELSVDKSDNGSPSKAVFRLKKAYPTTVPALRFLAADLNDAMFVDHTTLANAARFRYSANGVTWSNLGTIPNVVGTFVEYTFLNPPGVDLRPAIREA